MTSIHSRIISSVAGSFFVAGISFLTSILLARIMDSSSFGLYQYMLSVGQSFVLIASFNMGNAYYTYISKLNYTLFYHVIFALIQLLIFALVVFVILVLFKQLLFTDLEFKFILFCLIGSFGFFSLRQQSIYIFESQRKSVLLQIFLVSSSLINLIMIFILGKNELINVSNVFILMGFIYSILWVLTLYFCQIKNEKILNSINWRYEISSYKNYIMPLFFSLIVVQLGVIFDRWMLQTNSGSIEQGYFGIAYRIATIATILSAAIVNIFWKEISTLLNNNQNDEALNLLVKWHDKVFTIVLFGCLYIFINADKIIYFTYGSDYLDSIYALRIMAFYPLLQTSVHLLSTYLYSDALTFNIAKSSVISSIFGVVLIFLLFSFGTSISGSAIISYKYIASSLLLAFLLSTYLKVNKKLWSFKKILLHYPIIYLFALLFDNWLNILNIKLLTHLLFNGIFFTFIFIVYIKAFKIKFR